MIAAMTPRPTLAGPLATFHTAPPPPAAWGGGEGGWGIRVRDPSGMEGWTMGSLRAWTELHGTLLPSSSSSSSSSTHLLHGKRLEDAKHGETKHDVDAGRRHFDRGDAFGEGGGGGLSDRKQYIIV